MLSAGHTSSRTLTSYQAPATQPHGQRDATHPSEGVSHMSDTRPLTEEDVRRIVREEIALALAKWEVALLARLSRGRL